jgi:hypothetical protein
MLVSADPDTPLATQTEFSYDDITLSIEKDIHDRAGQQIIFSFEASSFPTKPIVTHRASNEIPQECGRAHHRQLPL